MTDARGYPDLTLDEKASLTSGADYWMTTSIERSAITSIMMTDGPNGLRKQTAGTEQLSLSGSLPATCFPPAVALGSSFDHRLAHRVGQALAAEAAAAGVAVLLGPGANIKRSPLCGRNFEYVSEDPIVSGVMAAALVNGLQSQGVGASVKHFAANNQEFDRQRSSSEIAERPLREIYLRSFQRIVEDSQPWTIMAAYNRINGVFACENRWLLTTVLRDEWGFGGLVISDWAAVHDRVAALAAGLDLAMPGTGGDADRQVIDAVNSGALPEAALDAAAARVIDLVHKAQHPANTSGTFDADAHHALAREVASRCIVLLKNDGALLPLRPDADVAIIGAFAQTPRFQGGGSAYVNPTRVDNALEHIQATSTGSVSYCPGFSLAEGEDDAALAADAVRAAAAADVAVVFLGLPTSAESEGFDREHMNLPANQLALLDAVREANPNVVVVLSNGGVVALPFKNDVPAIVETWLLGQAGGAAVADVLYGAVNPSGKLTETIPLRLQDTPAYGNFPGEFGEVHYGEGVLVGYRWYDYRDVEVAYPFGHGLSYTTFEYRDLRVEDTVNGDLRVTVEVSNIGSVAGREVVQVFTSLAPSRVLRAPRELKAFDTVDLDPGQTQAVTLTVRRGDLGYWDIRAGRFVVEGGDYTVAVAASSRDIRGEVTHAVVGDDLRLPLTMMSSVADVVGDPVAGPALMAAIEPALASLGVGPATGTLDGTEGQPADLQKIFSFVPVATIAALVGDPALPGVIEAALAEANNDR